MAACVSTCHGPGRQPGVLGARPSWAPPSREPRPHGQPSHHGPRRHGSPVIGPAVTGARHHSPAVSGAPPSRAGLCRNLTSPIIPMSETLLLSESMAAHSFVWIRVHCIWTTYRRQPWLDTDWRHQLYRCLSGIARRKGALLLCAGGVQDHIHLYLSLPPDRSIASLVNALKANSCRWIHATFPRRRLFAWQTGYAAFSVSKRSEQRLMSYILNQEAHHRREELQREMERFLDRHGLRPGASPGVLAASPRA